MVSRTACWFLAFGMTGCTSPVYRSPWREEREAARPETSIAQSIEELNASPETNHAAQRALLARMPGSLGPLIEELDLPSPPTRQSVVRATRALRVIRRSGRGDALRVCASLLLNVDYPREIAESQALMSEALFYLGDHFAHPDARDAYTAFVSRKKDTYFRRQFSQPHWSSGRIQTVFCVDVLSVAPAFALSGDPRVRTVMRQLIEEMTCVSYGGHALHLLDEEGYRIRYFQWREDRPKGAP